MSFHGSCESVAVPLLEHTALDHLIKLLTANPRFHDAFCSWFWLLRALGDTLISGKNRLAIARHCAHFVNQCGDLFAVRRLFYLLRMCSSEWPAGLSSPLNVSYYFHPHDNPVSYRKQSHKAFAYTASLEALHCVSLRALDVASTFSCCLLDSFNSCIFSSLR